MTAPNHDRRSAGLLIAVVTGLCLSTSLLVGVAVAGEKLPEVTHDGLHLVKGTGFQAFYLKPGAKLSGYSELKILDCFVAFDKNWERQQQLSGDFVPTPQQMEKIKQGLAAEFRAVFVKQMEHKSEFDVVDTTGPTVLILRPAIVNLEIEVPDAMDQVDETTYGSSAGQLTLYLELYDSMTSSLIARVMDTEVDQGEGMIEWENAVTNKAAADRILEQWADRLRQMLEQARKNAK